MDKAVFFRCFLQAHGPHCKNLCKGDYLIDNRPKNGAAEFEGEWIEFGSAKFPDWDSVLEYLNA